MRAVILLAGFAALAACAPRADKPKFNAAGVVDAIRADEVRWNADWKSGDAGKIAAHYAPDAVVMDTGEAPVSGIEAIRAAVQKTIDDQAFSLTFSSDKVDVAASGDLAASKGVFTETATDPTSKAVSKVTGTFVTVYKPQPGGGWKAVWDIATPGATMAGAAK
ncbi:MAG TPA: nuclear transport factor 2 family protein [Caulobacteraceae bacterium]|jgi:ketosteroid isomerase-like protein|nr:nuclear transport factor 2 family protein [Caulobacteraceae bacterium]